MAAARNLKVCQKSVISEVHKSPYISTKVRNHKVITHEYIHTKTESKTTLNEKFLALLAVVQLLSPWRTGFVPILRKQKQENLRKTSNTYRNYIEYDMP